PPANQYTAAPNQPTEQERLGEMVPQSAVPALTTAQKYLVTPFEKLSAGGRAAGEKTAEVLAPKPDLTGAPDWLKNAADVEQNIVRGVAGTVGATAADPRNWPFLASGAARPLLQHIISLGFTGMLSQQALHSAIDLHANWDKLTPGERAKLATDAGVAGMMAMGGAVNAINPRLAVGVNPEEVRVGIAANPLDTGPVGVEARFPRGGYKPPAGAPSAIEPPTIEGNAQPVPPRSPIGTTEPETGRPVLQQSARPEVTQAAATAEHPAVKDAISNIIKPIQGAELAGAREEKEPERLGEKIENEGQSPRTVRDYSGYRIAVDSPTAKDQVVTALKQNVEVHGEQDHFNEGDPDHGFHAHTLNVREPGSPVSHEVQILPREVAETADANHELYEKARDGDAKATAELKAKNEETYQQFAARQEAPNAVREPSTGGVDVTSQEAIGETGSRRSGMGERDQGTLASGARPEAAKEEIAAAPSVGTYFGPAATDSITGASKYPAQAGKGVGVPGETNAQVAAEKVATRQPGQPPVPPKAKTAKPVLGIDFDGTLFKENPDGSIGAPIPERIASLKEEVAAGKEVEIESKRAGHPGGVEAIHAALESVGLPRLPVTAKKTAAPTLIDNEGIKEPGVEVRKVPTDANTPLPGTPERLEVPQSKSERHNEALRQAREKLGLNPG